MTTRKQSTLLKSADRIVDHLRKTNGFIFHTLNGRGPEWIVHPDIGQIPDAVARKILERPDIQPGGDGMFGSSQTYRLRGAA
jgi:hypothetical protein